MNQLLLLLLEAMFFYFLILWAHSLRRRFGYAHFYALLGGITAIMSWITDAGVHIQAMGITFVVGSTVFYTSLLLGVFVIYVFDGPVRTRVAISTIAVISVMVPAVAYLLHVQIGDMGNEAIKLVPVPSLRINAASVIATLLDMLFLAIAWEFIGKSNFRVRLWQRSYVTLLGVMWLDVVLFASGAFAGRPDYLDIMKGTLLDRLVISVFAFPFLCFYLYRQSKMTGGKIENRPVLAILMKVDKIEKELSQARRQIDSLSRLLSICSICKRFRDEQGLWRPIENYIKEQSKTDFSHGICPDCAEKHYPGYKIY